MTRSGLVPDGMTGLTTPRFIRVAVYLIRVSTNTAACQISDHSATKENLSGDEAEVSRGHNSPMLKGNA